MTPPGTWVLLRGLTRERRHWGSFPETLARAMPGAPVIALDLAGNGALHQERSAANIPALAQACRAALHRSGMAPPYHLLAMSMGAMVAVSWASAHPQEVAAAVLINTSLRPFSPLHHRLRPAAAGRLLRLLLTRPDALAAEQIVLQLTSHAPQHGLAKAQEWAAYRHERPVSRANALRQLWAAARFRAPLDKPSPPLLVLTSATDELVDTRCSLRLAHAWRCAMASHPWAGHDLPLDDAPWVAGQLHDWLARGCPAAPSGPGSESEGQGSALRRP